MRLLIVTLLLCCSPLGCTTQRRVDLATQTGGSAFLFGQFQAFDGTTGRPLRFADLVARCRKADVVLFGEQHGNAVCNQIEAQLLDALIEAKRPVVLAMEFFEADSQAALDAYLTGRLDEPDFLKQSKRPSYYLNTHRPLIELSRAARVPVVAANAPRRLVSAYRKSGLPYAEYRAGVDAAERKWLPTENEYLEGPYRDRFAAIMSSHGEGGEPESQPTTQSTSQPASQPHARPTTAPVSQPATQPTSQPVTLPASQPTASMPTSTPASAPAAITWQDLYKSQLLWDEAMADSIADFRNRFPRHRAMLIVGGFHVAHEGGTALKLHRCRPDDKVVTIIYSDNPDGQFAFREEDRGAGDVVIYGLTPPKPETENMPMPVKKPESRPAESQPTTAPTTTPASAPATSPATAPATASVPSH
jgi:uncharacterized iron-regulated protein